MKLTATRLRIVLIAAIILLMVGGGSGSYFVVVLVGEQIRQANHTKIDADITANAGQSAARAKSELEKPDVAELLNFANSIIPSAEYRRQFLADVQKYAIDTGVSLAGVNFKDTAATSGATDAAGAATPAAVVPAGQAIPVGLTFGGSTRYENFIAFTKKLENNLQHIQITGMILQPESTNGSVLSSATLDIQLFVRK
ncbi:MAG TPA: hypothetical protein VFZ58_01235 [Candidatus Saccharimonadales bacterium]